MRQLFAAAIVAAACTPAISGQFDFDETSAKQRCGERFPGDFFMIKGCVDLEKQSSARIPDLLQSIPDDVAATVVNQCKNMALAGADSLFMAAGCIELQIESWRSLQ